MMTKEYIVRKFRTFDLVTVAEGSNWYYGANWEAQCIAQTSDVSFPIVCQVIARLSPRVEWGHNLSVAADVCRGLEPEYYMGYNQNLELAKGLAEGTVKWEPHKIRGEKIVAFCANIFDPDNSPRVTIDTHILRFLKWPDPYKKFFDSKLVYRTVENEFQKAAKELSILPHQLQAACWIYQKEKGEKRENGIYVG